MESFDSGPRGYGQRLRLSAGYFAGTLLEMLEVIVFGIAAGMVAEWALPNPAGVDEGRSAFLSAWGVGAAFGVLYILYRVLCRSLFGRQLVVPIPNDPNVDWYLTIRAVGLAVGGIVVGVAAFYHGLSGDAPLRIGDGAPFVDAVVGCLATGFLYLGIAKFARRALGR